MQEKVLINQFISAVTEEMVRKVLKERLLREPTVPFVELHELAIRWTELSKNRVRVSNVDGDCVVDFVTLNNKDQSIRGSVTAN